ncbi:MAG: nuclear transport factor 2 family protein [Cellvibrionaceae bacterium]|nr:nuclear transport factor 2 family protein [Cellvibrionaceae bacterium]
MDSAIIASNKALTKQFFQAAFIDFDLELTRQLITDQYIQHNPFVPSGAEAFMQILPILKEQNMVFSNHRLIADKEFVVSHNQVNNVPITGHNNVVTFDIWRVENGKLAEHWDNVTAFTASRNPSGHTQIDGATTVVDKHKTEQNKKLVLAFINAVLINGKVDSMPEYLSTDHYVEHNPQISDGIDTLSDTFKTIAEKVTLMRVQTIHLAVAEGNFVFTMSEGTSVYGKKTAFYNLFRVENDKIVEHWDVIEKLPEAWAHENGKF